MGFNQLCVQLLRVFDNLPTGLLQRPSQLIFSASGKMIGSRSFCFTVFKGDNQFDFMLYLTTKHVLKFWRAVAWLPFPWLLAWLTASLCVGFLRNYQHEFCDGASRHMPSTRRSWEVRQERSGADAYHCRFSRVAFAGYQVANNVRK